MADKITSLFKKYTANVTVTASGAINLLNVIPTDRVPVFVQGSTGRLTNGTGDNEYAPYIIGDQDANVTKTIVVYTVPRMGGVISKLLLALFGTGVRHERQDHAPTSGRSFQSGIALFQHTRSSDNKILRDVGSLCGDREFQRFQHIRLFGFPSAERIWRSIGNGICESTILLGQCWWRLDRKSNTDNLITKAGCPA